MVMFAGEDKAGRNVIWYGERVGDFVGRGGCGELSGGGIILEENTIIVGGLVPTNVGLGGKVIGVIAMNIEMVWLKVPNNGDVGGLFEIPELKT